MPTKTIYESHLALHLIRSSPTAVWSHSGDKLYGNVQTTITSGGPISDWRRRLALAVQATTPMDVVGSKITVVNDGHALTHAVFPGSGVLAYTEQMGCLTQLDITPSDPALFVIQSVQNSAKMDIVKHIRQAQTSLQGQVSLGEIGETVRMVNGAGRVIYRGVQGYFGDILKMMKPRNLTPSGLLRSISSRWLEYVFGWKPFINDIDDGMRAIARLYVGRPPTVFVSAKSQSEEKNPSTAQIQTIAGHTVSLMPIQRKTYGYKIYGQVSISNQGVGSLAHEFGIKLDEFVPTLYELIPFSFLADYFVNLGAVISAWSLNTSVIRWLNYGEMRTSEVEISPALISYNGPTSPPWIIKEHYIEFGTPFKFVRFTKSRNGFPSYSGLVPSLQFQIPGLSTKWLNIAALALQHSDTSRRTRSYRV